MRFWQNDKSGFIIYVKFNIENRGFTVLC